MGIIDVDAACYVVGRPFQAGVHTLQERNEYNYRCGRHELHMSISNPTPAEIAAVQRGPCEFALVVVGTVIFFLFSFTDEFPWSDCSYSIGRVSEEDRTVPDLAITGHALFTVILTNTRDGIVKALRAFTFSAEFTGALEKAIVDQSHMPFDRTQNEAIILDTYEKYPTPADMLPLAIARCRGGD